MSNTLRIYESNVHRDDGFFRTNSMDVTAYVGKDGRELQFSIGRESCMLTPNQIVDLISVLAHRLENEKFAYQATGCMPADEREVPAGY